MITSSPISSMATFLCGVLLTEIVHRFCDQKGDDVDALHFIDYGEMPGPQVVKSPKLEAVLQKVTHLASDVHAFKASFPRLRPHQKIGLFQSARSESAREIIAMRIWGQASQRALAKHLGVQQKSLSDWERGKICPEVIRKKIDSWFEKLPRRFQI